MKLMRALCAGGLVALLLAWLVATAIIPAIRVRDVERLAALNKALREAEELAQRADELGPALVQGLANPSNPNKARVRCARLLGKMRYTPAVPKLIEFIELIDEEENRKPNIEGRHAGQVYPCAAALNALGAAAVPHVVEAYLAEPNDRRARLLKAALYWRVGGEPYKAATVYAQGVIAERGNAAMRKRTRDLLARRVSEDLMFRPPDWWEKDQ
jgi:hypothetical protein